MRRDRRTVIEFANELAKRLSDGAEPKHLSEDVPDWVPIASKIEESTIALCQQRNGGRPNNTCCTSTYRCREAMKAAALIQFGRPTKLTVHPTLLENFGESFHVALRKGVDSRYSAIAYNAIHRVSSRIYRAFIEHMVEGISKHETANFAQFATLLRTWTSDSYLSNLLYAQDIGAWQRLQKVETRQTISIFDAAMNCMPDDDIEGIMSYMNYCIGVWTGQDI